MAAMTTLSGWGYEYFGVNVFWVMAAMGFLALFIKLKEPEAEISTPDIEATAQKSA
ncbi:probable 3-phenylpropionic acid transporter [Vibrio ishigakensis]|uniref:Probable 3-phenylpropionic acid transporter n=1 Tax=Vibrio ishigakensis TaxID=1481914 RepID=A0A0B8QMN0_9VIBR|nr:probable 3-phenylpropionic acid transporter [Vibrio ishigakensis]